MKDTTSLIQFLGASPHCTLLQEKIEEICRQRPESIVEVSPNNVLGIVLGPEHLSRVRGLGLGVVPIMAFKQTSRRFKHVDLWFITRFCDISEPS
uniref:Uncharacterized protein n=1 Tax=Solanum tuberosum TaxID=4113 RepID=M1ART5_SOLTU